jgi:hypothetical protein
MFKTRNSRLFRLSESGKRYKEFKAERERRYSMYREAGLQVPGEGDLLTATGWWLSAVPPENVTDKRNMVFAEKMGIRVAGGAFGADGGRAGLEFEDFAELDAVGGRLSGNDCGVS